MRRLIQLACLVQLLASAAYAQTIVQTRGVDSQVDYASLTRFGPWDDRNYQLTKSDLELLADNEAELVNLIPVFYRVELRRLGLPRSGPVQYPLSDLPAFFVNHHGYLVDGKLYRSARRRPDGRFEILFEDRVGRERFRDDPESVFLGEARVTNPNGAAESAVAISPANDDLVIAGSNGPGGGQRMHFSTDGGENWSQVDLPLGGTCCDPTVGWSSNGSLAYAATLAGAINAVWFYRSSNGGQTWDDLASEPGNDPRREIGAGGSDKEFLHVDVSPTSPFQDNIYLTWHQSNILRFSRSTDDGHTWSPPLVFNGDPTGIASDITSDAAGNIYYSWASFSAQTIVVKKSSDGGTSFAPAVTVDTTNASFNFAIPSQETRQAAIITCLDTDRTGGPFDDSVYVAWSDLNAPEQGNPADNHAQVKVAFSRDGGDTWTTTTPHETADVNEVDRWQQWLSVAPDGRVYVAFYDTRNDPTRAGVDVFFSVSEDGAQTWSTPQRLTTVTSQNATGGFEFGDYNGLDVALDDLMAIYTDNRDESGGGAQSKDIYVVGFDDLSALIFTDGFESGDTTAWSP